MNNNDNTIIKAKLEKIQNFFSLMWNLEDKK